MSHNISLKDVKFKDMGLLGSIVHEMSKGDAKLEMDTKTFRTYRGQPNTCDAMIRMPGRHDVGLQRTADGSYSPFFDPYTMSAIFRAEGGKNQIGALQREYAMQEAEYEAAQNGFSSTRVPGEKGVITLELVANN